MPPWAVPSPGQQQPRPWLHLQVGLWYWAMNHPWPCSSTAQGTQHRDLGASYQIRKNAGCMRNYRECFPRHRLQMKPLVSEPAMHHDTRVRCSLPNLTRHVFNFTPNAECILISHELTCGTRGIVFSYCWFILFVKCSLSEIGDTSRAWWQSKLLKAERVGWGWGWGGGGWGGVGGWVVVVGGGGLGPSENWWGCAAGRWKLDPKNRGKNGIWGQKDRLPKYSFCVGTPKKIEFNPQNVKKWGQNGGTSIFLNIEGVSLPPGW